MELRGRGPSPQLRGVAPAPRHTCSDVRLLGVGLGVLATLAFAGSCWPSDEESGRRPIATATSREVATADLVPTRVPAEGESLAASAPTFEAMLAAAATQLHSGLASAEPTIDAAGTRLRAQLTTAEPTLEAAGTRLRAGLATARPTLEAAATRLRGGVTTAQPTLKAAARRLGDALAELVKRARRWLWQETAPPGGRHQRPERPEAYTIEFRDSGRLIVGANCNRAVGHYVPDGEELVIAITAVTLADCGPDSLDAAFLKDLERVRSLTLQGEELLLHLDDGAAMRFIAGP